MMRKFGRVEILVLILYLMNGLLLLPGFQPARFFVRSAPYLASLGAFCWTRAKTKTPFAPGAIAMQAALLILSLQLLHPHTQVESGVAQLLLQFSIVCPVFWATEFAGGEERLIRVLKLAFICNAIGSSIGLLQTYFPSQFLPAEFSSAASANWLDSMKFMAPNGQELVRPPGLGDLPGNAAVSGSMTAILGLGFVAFRRTRVWERIAYLTAAMVGVAVLYLTQVRSLGLMTSFAIAVFWIVGMRRPQVWNRRWLTGAALIVVGGAFAWAASIGGEKVRDRFLDVGEKGLLSSYDTSRGWFWRYTFGEALRSYPLGAGLGRWGMMDHYFGQSQTGDPPQLWAEIQLTGWLYDGGVPMWLAYVGGLLTSMLFAFRMAVSRRYGEVVGFGALLVFSLNLCVIGSSFTGPSFSTTLGLQYWLLTALLCGTARSEHFRQAA